MPRTDKGPGMAEEQRGIDKIYIICKLVETIKNYPDF